MSSTSEFARLRLAARTLLEWKVPTSSRQYQIVLNDLLRVHANAKSWGLQPGNKLFTLDENGVILWYLSETLGVAELDEAFKEDPSDMFEPAEVRSAKRLHRLCLARLVEYGAASDSSTQAWVNGPQKSNVVERVIETFRQYARHPQYIERQFTLAYHVLVGMMLDEQDALRREIIEEFWSQSAPAPINSEIRRLAEQIRKSSTALTAVSLVLMSVSGILAFTKVAQSLNQQLLNSVVVDTKFLTLSISLITIIFLFLARVSFPSLKKGFAGLLFRFRFLFWVGDFDEILTLRFDKLIGFICTTKFKLFLTLLTKPTQRSGDLFDTLLYRTHMITTDAAKQLLAVIPSSDIDAPRKVKLLRRLTHIKIKKSEFIHRRFLHQSRLVTSAYNRKGSRSKART